MEDDFLPRSVDINEDTLRRGTISVTDLHLWIFSGITQDHTSLLHFFGLREINLKRGLLTMFVLCFGSHIYLSSVLLPSPGTAYHRSTFLLFLFIVLSITDSSVIFCRLWYLSHFDLSPIFVIQSAIALFLTLTRSLFIFVLFNK